MVQIKALLFYTTQLLEGHLPTLRHTVLIGIAIFAPPQEQKRISSE